MKILLARRALCAAAALALLPLGSLPALAADKISVTQYAVNVASLPWAIAVEKNMFQSAGLDIDGVLGSNGGGTTIRNIAASGVPFGEAAVPAVAAAIGNGSNLKIVYGAANNFGDLAWLVKADSPIKTIADLKGKKLAFTEPKSATEIVLKLALQKAKIDADTMPTGGIAAGIVALDQGAVDAAPFEEPLLMADPTKYRVVFRVSDVVPDIMWNVGVVDADYLKAHPDIVRKLIAVRRDAVHYMIAHPAEAEAIYHKVWATDDPRIAQILPQLIKENYWSDGAISASGLAVMLHGMDLVGALDKPLPPSAIDTGYLR